MNLFKNLNISKIIIFYFIIYIVIQYTNQSCSYNSNIDLKEYLNSTDPKENKQRCFDISNNFKNPKCCYNEKDNTCLKEDEKTTEHVCPNDVLVPNNCGLAGIYQPLSEKVCKEISLVQGHCCYVKIKDNNNNTISYSCLRTNKLAKNKTKPSDELIKYVNSFSSYEIESVDCGISYIKYYWILNLIINTILLCL